MTDTLPPIPSHYFTDGIELMLDETFERVGGIFLDKGTSLFETLATISAEEASRPVSATCANIAAQVDHVRFYLEISELWMMETPPEKVDWDEIWRNAKPVNEAEWKAIQDRLRATYDHLRTVIRGYDRWDNENRMAGVVSIIVHTAYHLGEIRQALCTIKQPTNPVA